MQEHAEIGSKASDLIRTFPDRFPNIAKFYFKTYSPIGGVEVRLNMNEVRSMAAESIQKLLRRHPASILVEEMLKHVDDDESSDWIEVSAVEFSVKLSELETECRISGKALALCSLCKDKSDREWHIPMMDFRIESGENIGQISALNAALGRLRQTHGVLLDSGNSYHYYGFTLFDSDKWKGFMTACLLLEPFVDVRYISHRMLAGRGSLRITAVPSIKPKAPRVISLLG